MRKLLALAFILVMPALGLAASGKDEPTEFVGWNVVDEGNDWRPISISQSTTTAVIISTGAISSGLGIKNWRSRMIINKSTCAALILYPSKYAVTNTSFSVVLSSDPTGAGEGDSVIINDQAQYWGVWTPDIGVNGRGAGGWEKWYNPNK